MKVKLNKNMENVRKNNETEISETKSSVSQILKIQLNTTPVDCNKWNAEF
jgi:hypothetical protein